ncbi:glycosyltransferase [Pseudoroseicyclus aestuarii]|uniref:Glycosyl transferase family 2 n=1 Tax=Pseudoroseicyclus aestuarii TaxID=1795041 RepID=A0A318SNG5_9RHOB|nr:glycosyltransferase [Pseudoroseicyclus aestuarii]PYE82236.1 glycosyl transferase family 2 [Pseudoroseicyclus aestuarii]
MATPAHVTIIIPCYNSEAWIGRTIASALEQSWPAKEVIVVDDGSTDGSVAAARAFEDRIRLVTGPNRGAPHARNLGLRMATESGADYVVFMDADDYFEGDMLSGAMRVATQQSADMVVSNIHFEYEDGSRVPRPRHSGRITPEALFEGWLKDDFINPIAVLWRTSLANAIGGWDESLARTQDMDITLRAMFERPEIYKNEEGAAIYCKVNPAAITRDPSLRTVESRLQVLEGLLKRSRGTSFEVYAPLMSRGLYHVARKAFTGGHDAVGRRALAAARREGFRGHAGSKAHRLAAGVLGLETKERLARASRRA